MKFVHFGGVAGSLKLNSISRGSKELEPVKSPLKRHNADAKLTCMTSDLEEEIQFLSRMAAHLEKKR